MEPHFIPFIFGFPDLFYEYQSVSTYVPEQSATEYLPMYTSDERTGME